MTPVTLPTAKAGQPPTAGLPAVPVALPIGTTVAASAVPVDLLKQYANKKPILVQTFQFKK